MRNWEPEATLRRLIEEAINRNDPALVDELTTENYVDHALERSPASPKAAGSRDQLKAMIADWHNAMPDFEMIIDEIIAEDDLVALRWTISGSHHGPFCGVPASGRTLTYSGFATARLTGTKLAESWTLCDRAGLWQQLGLIPPTADLIQGSRRLQGTGTGASIVRGGDRALAAADPRRKISESRA